MARTDWYSAKLLFVSVHSEERASDDATRLFEESIVVIQANDIEHARARAQQYGGHLQHGYQNAAGDWVVWQFVRLLDVFELNDERLADGVEVYARFIFAGAMDAEADVITRYFPEASDERPEGPNAIH